MKQAMRRDETAELLWASVPDLMYRVRGADGSIELVSAAFATLTGWSSAEWIGRPFAGLVHADDLPRAIERYTAVLRGEKPVRYEMRIRTKAGGFVIGEFHGVPVVEQGRVVGEQGIARDITDRRRRADEAREASEEQFRTLFESADEATFLMDGAVFVDMNSRCFEMFGLRDRSDMIGHSPMDYSPPLQPDGRASREKALEYILAAFQGCPQRFDWKHARWDGSTFDAEVSLKALTLRGRVYVQAIVRDITARRAAEQAMRESEERFRLLAAQVPADVWTTDADLRLTSLYGALVPHLERPDLRRAGTSLYELFATQDDSHPVIAAHRRALRGLSAQYERTVGPRVIEGRVEPLRDGTGIVVGSVGVALDITERRNAQSVARRLADFVESSEDAIVTTALDGIIETWNPAAERLYGYPAREAVGRPITLIAPPDSVAELQHSMRLLERGQPVGRYEAQRVRSDGRAISVSVTLSAMRDARGALVGFSGVVRDITERRRAEEALALNNAILATQQETSLDGILVVDEHGQIMSFNRHFVDLWGIPPEVAASGSDQRALESVIDKLVDPDGYLARVAWLYEHREERSQQEVALKDGRTFDRYSAPMFGADGRYYGRVWYFRDISQRKRAEQGLRESEARLQALFAGIDDALFVHDRQGRIIDCNDAACRRLGYSREELLAMHTSDVDAPEFAAGFQERLQQQLHGGGSSCEGVHVTKDGHRVPVDIHTSVIDYRGTKAVLALMRDITDRKLAEDARNQALSALQESAERFRGVYENTAIGLYRTTPDGRIVMANPALIRMLGFATFEEMVQRNLEESGYEPDYPRAEFRRSVESAGAVVGLESAWTRADGTTVWVRESAKVIRDSDGRALFYDGTVEDVTERKRAELELARKNVILSTQQETSLDGILVVDEHGKMLSFNQRFFDLWGISPEVAASGSDRRALESAVGKVVDPEGFMTRVEYLYEHREEKSEEEVALKDGRTLDRYSAPMFGVDGRYYGRVWYFRDITASRQAEQALKASETRFRSLIEHSMDLVAVLDVAGRIKYASPSVVRLLGYGPTELLGESAFDYVAPADLERVRAAFGRAASGGADEEPEVFGFRHKNGSWRSFESVVSNLLDNPAVGGLVINSRDVTDRQRSEESLRESGKRLQALFAGIDDALFVHDTEGRIIDCNEAACRRLGYSRDELLAMRTSDVDAPEFAEGFRDRLAQQVEMGRFVCEGVHLTKDGRRIPVDINSSVIEYHGKKAVLAVMRDITERKHAEAVLAKSEQELRNVLDRMQLIGLVLDTSGRITYCNNHLTEVSGWPREELIGSDCWSRFVPPGHPVIGMFQRAMATGEIPAHNLNDILTRDGQRREISWSNTLLRDSDGRLTGMVSIGEDITDRKRAEEELRRSETDFRGLVEHAPLGIYRVTADGHFLTVNPAFITMLGYGCAEEVLRLNATRDVYAGPDRRAELFAALAQHDQAGTETEWKRKDGSFVTVRVTLRAVRGPAGQVECYEGLVEDVTEQRSIENQFRQAQRMEAVGRLAGGVAHDFNNILTAITGYSELLLDDLAPDDPKRQDVEEIRLAAQRATALTRQLLAFSRKQVLQTRVLDLNDLVRMLDKMLRRLIGEDVKLEIVLHASLGTVRADPGQLEQVILNLAVNSRDAMPNGGRLTLETANVDLDEAYAREHAGATPGRYVMLAVNDTGVGMDAETRSHIFEPFFTTKEPGKGTGLGLATVYGIVKQSGGYVSAYSEPGHGTTFKIYLPRVDEVPEAKEPATPVQAVTGGRETVLLAEDDPSVRAVVSDVLAQKGYEVLRAPDGQTALEMARARTGDIPLLVTDIVMPGMTGRELAEALRAERPGIRVLYMSGYTDDAVVRHGVLKEGMPYLQKPFTPRALTLKVRELLDRP